MEETLLAHPAVTEAAVFGAPDRVYGELVVACVTLRVPWTIALNDSLRALCAEQLARYKCPTRIIPLPAMPRTNAGKLDRPRLRAEWARPDAVGGRRLGDNRAPRPSTLALRATK